MGIQTQNSPSLAQPAPFGIDHLRKTRRTSHGNSHRERPTRGGGRCGSDQTVGAKLGWEMAGCCVRFARSAVDSAAARVAMVAIPAVWLSTTERLAFA